MLLVFCVGGYGRSCRHFTSMAERQPAQDGSRSFWGGGWTFPSPLWWTSSHPQIWGEGRSGDLLQEVSELLSAWGNRHSKCDRGGLFHITVVNKVLTFLQVYEDRRVCSCNDREQSRHHWDGDCSLSRPLQEHLLQVGTTHWIFIHLRLSVFYSLNPSGFFCFFFQDCDDWGDFAAAAFNWHCLSLDSSLISKVLKWLTTAWWTSIQSGKTSTQSQRPISSPKWILIRWRL